MKTKKHILAFELLEKEMEMILAQEMESLKGGDGPADCVFQSIAFITGQSVQQVQDHYATYYNQHYGVSWMSGDASGYMGVSGNLVAGFLNEYGLTPGYSTHGTPYGSSSSGSMGIIILFSGNDGHAIDITGMANSTTYYYYDAQAQTTGTISTTDTRIKGIYSAGGGL